MSVLCDSTVLIDVLRGMRAAAEFLDGLEDPPYCSEITRIEIIQGQRSHERQHTAALLDQVAWIPVDSEVADCAGNLGRLYRASHALAVPDLCIAATAVVAGLRVATTNVKHFPMFPDLQPPYEPG